MMNRPTPQCPNSVNTLSELLNSLSSDNISYEEMATLIERSQILMKRKEILDNHTPKPKLLKRGLWYTKLGGRQVTALEKKSLEDKIVEYYVSQSVTINTMFDDFIEWRKMAVSPNTWAIDKRTYDKFITTAELADIPITEISLTDAEKFLKHCLSIKPDMTRNYWNNQILATINAMFKYMIAHHLRFDNPFNYLYIGRDFFSQGKKTRDQDKVFEFEEQKAVMSLAYADASAHNDIRALGINLLFYTGIRIGELSVLKWSDISPEKRLHVQRELVINRDDSGKCHGHKVLEHCKTEAGDRWIPLNKAAITIFDNLRCINAGKGYPVGDDDFIFLREYRGDVTYCTERSFFAKLQTYCKKAGMSVCKSHHDIRRTVITNLYCSGLDTKAIQNYVGHSSLQQTLDYVKAKESNYDRDVQFFENLSGDSYSE